MRNSPGRPRGRNGHRGWVGRLGAMLSLAAATTLLAVSSQGAASVRADTAWRAVDPDQDLHASVQDLEKRFGDHPSYAGVHVVNGRPTVNVTGGGLAGRVSDRGAATKTVSTPLAKLESAARQVEARAGRSVEMAIPDISENRLYVMVSDEEPDARATRAVERVRAAGVRVTVQRVEMKQLGNVYGGRGITSFWPGSQAVCSAGFNARNADGQSVTITAGHCGPVGSNWDSLPLGGYVGTMNRRNLGQGYRANDWGIIGAFAGVHNTPAQIKDQGVTKDVRRHRMPIEGERVCRNGATTNNRCGTVLRFLRGRAILTSAWAEPGDSGGPLYHRIRGTNNVAALGTLKGALFDTETGEFVATTYQPIGEILNVANLRLKTRR